MQHPIPGELRDLAYRQFLDLSDEQIESFLSLIDWALDTYERIDDMSEPCHQPSYENKNPFNAFVIRCRVEAANDGPFSGYEFGVKNNISVAGVEMTCGSEVMRGYFTERDATAVQRVLKAG